MDTKTSVQTHIRRLFVGWLTIVFADVLEKRLFISSAIVVLLLAHGYSLYRGHCKSKNGKKSKTWLIVIAWIVSLGFAFASYHFGLVGKQMTGAEVTKIFDGQKFDPTDPAQALMIWRNFFTKLMNMKLIVSIAYLALIVYAFFPEPVKELLLEFKGIANDEIKKLRKLKRADLLRFGKTLSKWIVLIACAITIRYFTKDWLYALIGVFVVSSILSHFLGVDRVPMWFRFFSLLVAVPIEVVVLVGIRNNTLSYIEELKAKSNFDSFSILFLPSHLRLMFFYLLFFGFAFGYKILRDKVVQKAKLKGQQSVSPVVK